MQAMNGSGRAGSRRLGRLVGCVVALAALAAMMVPSIAAAHKPRRVKETYLALGDSLAFGYSQQLFNENIFTGENPTGFEHGYASDYYNLINTRGMFAFVNDGCPGETSASLIGTKAAGELNSLLAGHIPEPITGEAPCAYNTVDGLPLHHEYGAGKSQLESAIETVEEGAETHKPVKVITLDIGANDQLHEIAKLEKEAEAKGVEKVTFAVEAITKTIIFDKIKAIAEKEVETFVIEQVIPQAFGESGGVEPAFAEDIAKDAAAYSATHGAELAAKVGEDIEIYSIEHAAELAKEGETIGAEQEAKYLAEHGAELKAEGEAFVFKELAATAPAVGKQIIVNETGIIAALKGNGFKGKFILEGTYDAYGNDYGTGELLPGSNALLNELNTNEKLTFKKGPDKACYSDAQKVFNVGGAQETINMETWTNMANFGTTNGKSDGPDIHATPVGYEVMAKQIKETCKA